MNKSEQEAGETEIAEAEEMQDFLDGEYYIQIQGSDRKYPSVVLRKKDRKNGSTIMTISKFGKYSHLYERYEEAIKEYFEGKE